jgi:hypothetical protein
MKYTDEHHWHHTRQKLDNWPCTHLQFAVHALRAVVIVSTNQFRSGSKFRVIGSGSRLSVQLSSRMSKQLWLSNYWLGPPQKCPWPRAFSIPRWVSALGPRALTCCFLWPVSLLPMAVRCRVKMASSVRWASGGFALPQSDVQEKALDQPPTPSSYLVRPSMCAPQIAVAQWSGVARGRKTSAGAEPPNKRRGLRANARAIDKQIAKFALRNTFYRVEGTYRSEMQKIH